MSEHFDHIEHVDVEAPIEERAEAIARGEQGFATERTVTVVSAAAVNRLLVIGVAVLSVIAVVAIVSLTVFSLYRASERQGFRSAINELSTDLKVARDQRDQLQDTLDATTKGIECRAQSQLDVDRAQANTLLVIAQQFAAAVDQAPPRADPNVVNASAAALQKAIEERQSAIERCRAG